MKQMSEAQRSYEAKRAAKAGMTLDKWLAEKTKQQTAATREQEKTRKQAQAAVKKPNFLSRLLDRAHKPL